MKYLKLMFTAFAVAAALLLMSGMGFSRNRPPRHLRRTRA